MKLKNIFFALAIIASIFTGCKEGKKKKRGEKLDKIEKVDEGSKKIALSISGMTCEIGCAKYIESKLLKQDGVLEANVVFGDSIAKIKYNPLKTNKASLMSLVDGLAENMYKSSEVKFKESCKSGDKEDCCKGEKKKECKPTDKEDCCKEKKEPKTAKACGSDCGDECCKDTKTCKSDCVKTCCNEKEVKSCEKTCCRETKVSKESCEKEC